MKTIEVNFDGLVGPTHNYAGLSPGNLASVAHKDHVSNPHQAALQGLEKMRQLHQLGVPQAILPPQFRPDLHFLRQSGFRGSAAEMLRAAASESPGLLSASCSAASMWTANAATVSPSADCEDGKIHVTPANLFSGVHRAIEAQPRYRVLNSIFAKVPATIHLPLPGNSAFADEGAANQMRLAAEHSAQGLEVFVFGRDPFASTGIAPTRFPGRQTRQAFESIARRHLLDFESTVFVQQNPAAIDAGAFHNDVVAVANLNVLLCHELAFVNQIDVLHNLARRFETSQGSQLHVIQVANRDLPLEEAVRCYLFNSQIVSLNDGRMVLIAPTDCQDSPAAMKIIEQVLGEPNPITDAIFPDVRQSMMNGGGPACLRLRVVMTEAEYAALPSSIKYSEALHRKLTHWVDSHFRRELSPADLSGPDLFDEVVEAMQVLEILLGFPENLLIEESLLYKDEDNTM